MHQVVYPTNIQLDLEGALPMLQCYLSGYHRTNSPHDTKNSEMIYDASPFLLLKLKQKKSNDLIMSYDV